MRKHLTELFYDAYRFLDGRLDSLLNMLMFFSFQFSQIFRFHLNLRFSGSDLFNFFFNLIHYFPFGLSLPLLSQSL